MILHSTKQYSVTHHNKKNEHSSKQNHSALLKQSPGKKHNIVRYRTAQ